jgi:hypothetical protein
MSKSLIIAIIARAIQKSREAVQALVMRAGTVVNVTPVDRRRLEAIVADRNRPQNSLLKNSKSDVRCAIFESKA